MLEYIPLNMSVFELHSSRLRRKTSKQKYTYSHIPISMGTTSRLDERYQYNPFGSNAICATPTPINRSDRFMQALCPISANTRRGAEMVAPKKYFSGGQEGI